MRKFISILLLFICKISLAQIVSNGDTINRIDTAGKRQGHWIIYGEMNPSPACLIYKPRTIAEEGYYLDNKKTGVWKAFYPNGNKKSEMTFVNGRPNGHVIIYFENGHVNEEGTWKGTRWVGDYKMYYENDTIRQRFHYNQLGQKDSIQNYYNISGKLYRTEPYQDGKEHGWQKEYNDSGRVFREIFFVEGVEDPARTKTYPPLPDSNSKSVYPYGPPREVSDGTDCELQHVLYKDGRIVMKGTFKNHKLINGEQRVYDDKGNLTQIKLYKDGKYIGDKPPAEKSEE